jgi:LacI family transcriptional regulator
VGLLVDFDNWHYPYDFPWSDYPVVALSPHPLHSTFASVIAHTSNDVLLSVEECRKRGYSRIGFLAARWYPDWRMGFAFASECYGGTLRSHQLAMHRWDPDRFLAWLKRYRPDAILANEGIHLRALLEAHGLRVPDDVGYCCLHVTNENAVLSGIRQLSEEMESQGVALLHQQIMRGQKSADAAHIHLQLSGIWNEGETLRPRS